MRNTPKKCLSLPSLFFIQTNLGEITKQIGRFCKPISPKLIFNFAQIAPHQTCSVSFADTVFLHCFFQASGVMPTILLNTL